MRWSKASGTGRRSSLRQVRAARARVALPSSDAASRASVRDGRAEVPQQRGRGRVLGRQVRGDQREALGGEQAALPD
eukprot:1739450-Rhodomonas_salina.1